MRFLLSLSLLLVLSSPVMAQDASGTIAVESTVQNDADIANRIREILAQLDNYEDVTVTVTDGVVTLTGTTTSTTEVASLDPLANRVEGVVAVKNQVTETTDIARRLNPALERFLARVDQLVTFLPLALIALAVFLLVVLLGVLIARMKQPWDRLAPNAFIAELFRQFVRIAFVVLGIVIALDILNATALLSTILGAAGIIGLALGFAVRDTVENYIASVMLSIRQPFRPNDVVEINGDQGKVIRLTSRATILLSFDGNHIRIPNATVFKSRIINFTQNAERRFAFPILVDRDVDLQAVRTLVAETVQGLPFVLTTPAAETWIEDLDPSGVRLMVTGWIDQVQTSIVLAKGEAIRQAKLALENAGIPLVNTTQVIALQRGGETTSSRPAPSPPKTGETTRVATVEATSDDALEELINAERGSDEAEDLLRPDAQKE
jgi:small-conductance mechanosensitive channel